MVIDRRCSWRECEVLLEWTSRMEYRVFVHVKSVEIKRNVGVGIGVRGKGLLPCMIERVITQSSIPVWIIGYDDTVGRVYLGRKLGRALS